MSMEYGGGRAEECCLKYWLAGTTAAVRVTAGFTRQKGRGCWAVPAFCLVYDAAALWQRHCVLILSCCCSLRLTGQSRKDVSQTVIGDVDVTGQSGNVVRHHGVAYLVATCGDVQRIELLNVVKAL